MNDLKIKPLKPESGFKTYAGLLTENDVALILKNRPLEFDVDNYKAFCIKFKLIIDKRYDGKCLPMFFIDNTTIGSSFEKGLVTTTLQNQPTKPDSTLITNATLR